MSMMLCTRCDGHVDTDEDLDSLYVKDGECICEHCRDEKDDEILERLYGK